jgi:hypothetical protein
MNAVNAGRFLRASLVALLILAGAQESALGGPSVYVASADYEFGTLDVNTGDFTLLGMFPPPAGRQGPFPIYGLGFTGPGQLSAVDARGNVFSVDPANAAETPLFSTGAVPNGGGGDGRGNLYLFDSATGNVDAINIASGSVSVITSFPGVQSTGFTAIGPDGSLYITVSNPASSSFDFYRIDPATANVTHVGPDLSPDGLYAGAFVGSTLYGFDPNGGIYTIDTTDGAETLVADYSLPGGPASFDPIYAAAFQVQSVPEPSSLALLAIGGVAVGLGAARRRG